MWVKEFNNIVNKIEKESINIGAWQTELSNPNEIVTIWSHSSLDGMQTFWDEFEKTVNVKTFWNFKKMLLKMNKQLYLDLQYVHLCNK